MPATTHFFKVPVWGEVAQKAIRHIYAGFGPKLGKIFNGTKQRDMQWHFNWSKTRFLRLNHRKKWAIAGKISVVE